ncbi:MAG: amino acid decarboxylase [Clostridium sp.]|nr:amino acid decarboxylase [Clostridium sp.]
MPTPLYDALKAYAAQSPARFHMPGHKGALLPCPELAGAACIDVTEIPPTGNLYEAGEPFDTAQALWAVRVGFDNCQFLTGGSTMGVHTAFALCCPPGSGVLVDRGCHRSVFHAMALLDLQPVYLERPWLAEENLCGPFSAADVEKALDSRPDLKTVCITSPTYSGLLSDIPGISALIHARGGKLIVDGAHGAHLPFLGLGAFSPADCVVMSAHKTLPALGQTALLFTNGFDPARVRRTAAIYGSSSPSYPMLASLDAARDWMEGEGEAAYRRVIRRAQALRQKFPALSASLPLDPTRLTLKVQDGPAFARALEVQGIYPEMEDGGHVVFILTGCDSEDSLTRLERALEGLRPQMGPCAPLPRPPLPERVLSLRQALFSPAETLPLSACEGRIAACQVAPYPPGVPVVAPGERIGKKELSYFREIGYNISSEITVVI